MLSKRVPRRKALGRGFMVFKRLQLRQQHDRPIVNVTMFAPPRWRIMRTRLLISLLLLLPLSFGWWIFNSNSPIDWIMVAFLLGTFFLVLDLVIYLGWLVEQPRLITSPVGIEYFAQSYTVRTSWSNLTAIGEVSLGGVISQQGVLARRTTIEMTPSFQATVYLQPWLRFVGALMGRPIPEFIDLDKLGAGIPVAIFDPDWSTGTTALGSIIRRHAPQIFGEPQATGLLPAPDSFPPLLYPLVRPLRS
jgi:hypothetical protein